MSNYFSEKCPLFKTGLTPDNYLRINSAGNQIDTGMFPVDASINAAILALQLTSLPIINVQSAPYNAIPNDTAIDNGPRILLALEAAALLGGGAVIMPFGTYYVSTEILPDFDMQYVFWGSLGGALILWNGSTDATKAVFRSSVSTARYFTNNWIRGIDFRAANKAGYGFLLEGTAPETGNGSSNYVERCAAGQGTVASMMIGGGVYDGALSLTVLDQPVLYNSPVNLKVDAPNAYETTIRHGQFISNVPNKVQQHIRLLNAGMTRIDGPEFGNLGQSTAAHPNGASDNIYCVYAESPFAMRNVYGEETRLAYIADASHSNNAWYSIENVYTNDSVSDANLDNAYAIYNTNAYLNLKNANFIGGGALAPKRRIYSGVAPVIENVTMGSGTIEVPGYKNITGYVRTNPFNVLTPLPEILTNGTFFDWTGDDPVGWTGNAYTRPAEKVVVHDGSTNSVKFSQGIGQVASLTQACTFVYAQRYKFAYWLQGDAANPTKTMTTYLTTSGANFSINTRAVGGATWVYCEDYFYAPNNATGIVIEGVENAAFVFYICEATLCPFPGVF